LQFHKGLCLLLAGFFIFPIIVSFIPISIAESSEEEGWWVETTVDRNGDGIGDMIEVALATEGWVGSDRLISIIIDFDHTPTQDDITMLEKNVAFEHEWDLPLIDAVVGTIPTDEIISTSNLDGVVMLELDGVLGVQMDSVNEVHRVPQVWQETGYTGLGTTVAIIDTGIDSNHSGLDDLDDDNSTYDPKVIAFYDAVNNADSTNGTDKAYDDQGHGSHCAGITAGTGAPNYDYVGVAPQARLVGVKVLDADGSGSFGGVMAGMQWTVDHRYEFNIRAASMSLGGFGLIEWTSSEEDSVNRMANEMVESGVALFIAAGNSAVRGSIGTPGSAEDAITVGALDKDTSIAIYSSQGPTEENRVKPNVAFVGSNVWAPEANSGNGYTDMSGTSMATPGAAGVSALMLQANPDLQPLTLRNIMQETSIFRHCTYMGDPAGADGCDDNDLQAIITKNRQNNVYGHGQVDAPPAIDEAASQYYGFNKNISINVTTPQSSDNKVHLKSGDQIDITLSEPVDSIQWRSNHLHDEWITIHGYEGSVSSSVSHLDIVHTLEHLPGINVTGNHTISIRGITGDEASLNAVVDIYVEDAHKGDDVEDYEGLSDMTMLLIGLGSGIFVTMAGFGAMFLLSINDVKLFSRTSNGTSEAETIDD